MGCFDVACGISGITIKRGDDALLLLIMPYSNYPDGDKVTGEVTIKKGVQQVFNEGPLGMYMPFCLPVRGKYNDYGSLEEIVEDETVKGLQKLFGATFEQIIEIIYRGEYGKLHDEEIIRLYGTGLKIASNHSGGTNVTDKWLIEAGFTERDGKFYHPKVTNILKWGKDEKIEKTEEQKCYVEFKVPFKGSNEKRIMPHIVWWENDKWNEIWHRDQKDFCESFMEKSQPMGWFSADYGVVLGIKEDHLPKAMLLRKLSAMFIDAKVYGAMTEEVKTNAYYKDNNKNGVRSNYMNKFLMEKIGFKFERSVDDKTKQEPDKDGYFELEHLYSHKNAPGYLFGVRDSHSMATDMYTVEADGSIKELKRNINKYHPFSPDGLAKMFEGIVGTALDLSSLDNVTSFDIFMMGIQEFVDKKDKDAIKMKELESKVKELESKVKELDGQKDKEDERNKLLRQMWKIEDRSESREKSKERMGYLNFPYVWKLYLKSFKKPSKDFLCECKKFKNLMVSLWGINRPLMPSSHFGQHGDYENQLVFHKIVADVVKDKILAGHGIEFSTKDEMFDTIKLIFGDDYYEKPDKTVVGKGDYKKEQTLYMHKGEEVAVWYEKDNYGYLITEEGL